MPYDLMDMVRQTAAGINFAVGLDVGLVGGMAKNTDPRTSTEIAESLGLKERYVREWLNGMVCSGHVMATEGEPIKYHLTAEAADQWKGPMQILPFLMVAACSESFFKVAACFKADGPNGVPYSDYPHFRARSDMYASFQFEKMLISGFITLMPQDLQEKLKNGAMVADVGCGGGFNSRLLAKAFPKSTIYGVDLCDDAVQIAREKAKKEGISNVEYHAFDAASMPAEWDSKFDFVTTFDVIHDSGRPDLVLSECRRILKSDGIYSFVDINGFSDVRKNSAASFAPTAYSVSLFHCMPVSLAQPGGVGLGTMWGNEKAMEMLLAAGFTVEKLEASPFGPANNYAICRKGDRSKQ